MNRAICVSLAFFLGPAGLAAQTTVTVKDPPIQTTAIQVAPWPGSCPVSLRAKQAPGGDRMVVNGVPRTGIAQNLHLTVSAPDSKRIVAANVTVRGFTKKPRVMPTMANQDTGDAAKTLDVRFPTSPEPASSDPASSDKEISADLAVPGLTAVTVIDLNSVTYADGSNWKLAAGSTCRSWIDGFMRVSMP